MSAFNRRFSHHESAAWPWIAIGAVAALAAFLRLYQLDTLPSGMHGDEAYWGLLAEQVTNEGWIGPYTSGVAGAPTGTTYLMAPAVALFGNTIFAVRLMSALAGTLTIAVLYIVARRHTSHYVALIGCLFLATLGWHLHFSRTGFPLIWWPLVTVLAAHSATMAIRHNDVRWWATCGALTAFGLYFYNAQPLYGAIVGLFLLVATVRQRAWLPALRGAAVATVAGIIVLLPMIAYALDDENDYFEHFQDSSITEQDDWRERETVLGKLDLIGDRYADHWYYLYHATKIDAVDGTGSVALVPVLFLYLAAVGGVLTVAQARRREPFLLLGLLIVLLLPLSSATTEGGMIRRSFAAAPFIALFAGVAIDELVRIAQQRERWQRILLSTFALAVIASVVAASLLLYFDDFADRDVQRVVLADDMTDATQFMEGLPDDAHIYFYADKFSFDYTIRRFLAPHVQGINRSREFGTYGISVDRDLGQPVFILLGTYRDDIDAIRARHPGGMLTVGGPEGNPTFVAYEVE